MSVYDKIRDEMSKEKLNSSYFDYSSAIEAVGRVEKRESQEKLKCDKPKREYDCEKLYHMLEDCKDSSMCLEDIIFCFINAHYSEFPASRVNRMISALNNKIVSPRIAYDEHVIDIAMEKATYLKAYISGAMYETEESAKIHAPVQAQNAEAIIAACVASKEGQE